MTKARALSVLTLDQLTIEDESTFRIVGLYAELKEVLERAKTTFRVLSGDQRGRWDRALFLNLTFWSASESGSDVLIDDVLAADVVAHVAWHYLAGKALFPNGSPSAEALFFGEAIASAFDLYLVGRVLGRSKSSSFLETQVPAMAEAADAAGLAEEDFEALLASVASNPEQAFEDLRQLLFDASVAMLGCKNADEAYARLEVFDAHRFGALLHHYELANWVLYARAYAPQALGNDSAVRQIDAALRASDDSVEWLRRAWVVPVIDVT